MKQQKEGSEISMKISLSNLYKFSLFAATVLLYLMPSFLNGYPLLMSDSGTYFVSGQTMEVPVDRPITYGLFVRHLSLSWSIWLIGIIQAILINYTLWTVSKFVLKAEKPFLIHFILSSLLFILTGISYHSNLIIADVFTSISVITLFVLLIIPRDKKGHFIFLSILFCWSIIVHLSHIPLALGLIVFGVLVNLFRKRKLYKFQRSIYVASLMGISLLSLATLNYSLDAGFKLSKTKNIVLSARLIECGIANEFLKKQCASGEEKSYSELCSYVDKFGQWPSAGAFLWIDTSPIYDGDCTERGWASCWLEKEEMYGDLVSDILSEPDYQKDMAAQIIAGTLKQLINFEQSILDPVNLKDVVKAFYGFDSYSHEHSTQFKRRLTFFTASTVESIVFDLSLILILFLLFKRYRNIDPMLKWFLLFVVIALLGNAFICSTFSNYAPRYQGRIAFLLPMATFLILFGLVKDAIQNKRINLNNFFK